MKKYLFLLILPILFLLPKDTFAEDINSSGWYSGYKDYYGKPVNSSLSIIDIGSPYGFSGGTITQSVEYVVLDKSTTYSNSIVGSLNYYDKINYISELDLFASASFKKDSFYTINFKFNSGSYIVYDFDNIHWLEANILMYDGNEYTTAVSSPSINVDFDYNTYSGVISVTFKATITTDYVQIRIGNYNSRFASRLIYNNQDTYNNGFRVYLLNVDESQSLSDALLGQLASQNQTIINQNQEIINNSNQTNENLKDIEDSLTSEESPDTSELGDVAGWLPPGPVDSILNLPLTLFQNINNALGGTCTPVTATLPFIDYDITLPCMSTIYTKLGISDFLNWLGVIAGGFILYNYLLHLYQWVEDRLTLKDGNIEWGGN